MGRRRGAHEGGWLRRERPGGAPGPRFADWLAVTAQSRRDLKERRADLDRRVASGEITAATRARYLEVERRRLRRMAGNWPDRLARRFVAAVLPVVALPMLVAGAAEIGPAYAAAQGHGTRGYFTAVKINVCSHPGYCSWRGDFVSTGGGDVRRDVLLAGDWTGVVPGTRLSALDSGDPFDVFPRSGSTQWQEDVVWLVVGTAIMALWLWIWPWPRRRLRRLWRKARRRVVP